MNFTPNQQTAIDDRGGTLLVAAGAGSGKTAVLTSRLIDRLCDPNEDADISAYLVVTFTKAATQELRNRLYKALSERVAKEPSNARARRQLSLLGLARISTVHSFCLDLVRSHFEALSLPAHLRMGDDAETAVLCRATLERILAERYEQPENDPLFLKAMEILSDARSDENFIEGLLALYRKLRSSPEPFKRYDRFLEKYREVETASDPFMTAFGERIRADLRFETERARDEFRILEKEIAGDEALSAALSPALLADAEYLDGVLAALEKSYGKARDAALAFTSARAKPVRGYDAKDVLDLIKDKRKKAVEDFKKSCRQYLGADADTVRAAARETAELLTSIRRILKELDEAFREKKLEKGILDYADLEEYAFRLLVADTGENTGVFRRTPLAEQLSATFREIYIDEYQDTNRMQDLIFRALSRVDGKTGTECDRFLVGDIKQSIYRFRGAQPDIFAAYTRLFPLVGSQEAAASSRHKLYLSHNFRCSGPVVGAVNQVFSTILSDYSEDERLIHARAEEHELTAPCELVLVQAVQEGNENVEKVSAEAQYIAARIRDMVNDPAVTNDKGERYRYSDFAVLSRSANAQAPEYRRAFRCAGVPLAPDTPEDFFGLPEILLALCLLHLVDNPQRDIYAAGAMASPLFGFTADDLVRLRSEGGRKMPFFSAVVRFSEGEGDDELHEKTRAFLEKLARFRKLSRGTPTDVLLRTLYDETGLLDLYPGSRNPKRRNLMTLYEMARGFEKTSFRGLSSFLEYLMNQSQGKAEVRTASETDSVRFMSIHRSKGLEFPVVFLCGAAREFNLSDEKQPIVVSDDGVGIKLRDTPDTAVAKEKRNFTAINTPFRQVILSDERRRMQEEEKRLLYVAMTRAKDRLIVTGETKDAAKTYLKVKTARDSGFAAVGRYAMSYFDFLVHALTPKQYDDLFHRNAPRSDGVLTAFSVAVSTSPQRVQPAAGSVKQEPDEALCRAYLEQIQDAQSRVPAPGPLTRIASKLSVSQLKKGLLDEDMPTALVPQVKKLPSFMEENTAAGGAEKGTAAHTFMQFTEYARWEKDGTAAEAKRLLEQGFLTKRMYDLLDYPTLETFLHSELYEAIKHSPRLYRERRFNLRLPASEFSEKEDAALSGAFILVQGVIDLYFDNGDGTFTLVDFKTDRVRDPDGETVLKERHGAQLSYYRRAIEEITSRPVSQTYLYSFALGREVRL